MLSSPVDAAPRGSVPPAGTNADQENLSGAVPAATAAHLPSTASRYRELQAEIAKSRPVVADAERHSESLKAEAAELRRRLIETAGRVQELEQQKLGLDADIATLAREAMTLSTDFLRQRAEVSQLLAVLERTQRDMPP